jgi:hypothetical protein
MALTMTSLFCGGLVLLASAARPAQPSGAEGEVRAAVEAFYAAFNRHSFDAVPVTDDWEHINPAGGTAQGRAEVLEELQEVHSTFLKGVSDRLENVLPVGPEAGPSTAPHPTVTASASWRWGG